MSTPLALSEGGDSLLSDPDPVLSPSSAIRLASTTLGDDDVSDESVGSVTTDNKSEGDSGDEGPDPAVTTDNHSGSFLRAAGGIRTPIPSPPLNPLAWSGTVQLGLRVKG